MRQDKTRWSFVPTLAFDSGSQQCNCVDSLARETGLPSSRIADIVAGKSPITADTDLRLCRYFGMSDGWWLRGQASYDTAIARGTAPDISVRQGPA